MLDKTWVPQRKRKLIPSVVDVHNGKEEASYSADCTNKRSSKIFKDESDASRYSEKIKGHDGYYFECEECDLGGNLLCCDSCPRTYHLECLNPPLKRAPSGKWKCPKCCNQFDKALSSSETSSKRARSKMTKKSMAVRGMSSSNKESHLGRSFLASCKSRRKEKASPVHVTASVEKKSSSSHVDISSSIKSNFSDDNVLRNGELSTASCKKIKKRTASSPHQKISAHMAVRTLENSLNLDASDKLPKDKPDLYGRENRGKKFKMPLVVSSQISKKKRKRINKIGKEISKSFNGKHASSVSNCPDGEVSLCPEFAGSLPKCKSSEHLNSLSNVKQEVGLLKSLRLKGPKIGHQEFSLPPGLIGHVENDRRNTYQEVFHDNQQVDRILGCRIQINVSETTSPVTSQAEIGQHQSAFRTCDLISKENRDQPSGCFDANKAVDMDLKNGIYCGVPDVITHKMDGDLYNELHKDMKSKTCRASGNFDMTEEQLSSSLQSTQDNCTTDEGNELGDDLARDAKVRENSSKKVFDGGINVELLTAENYSERLLSRTSDLSGTCEIDHVNAAMGSKCDHRSEIVAVSQSMQELRSKDSDSVSYEFFVKWAGKSNIHNSWITEDKLKGLAKRKLENYKTKYGTAIINICEEQWYKPQRIIALHEFENGDGKAFVKWHGLPYDECTWEKLDEPVIRNSSHLILELKHFESQTLVKDCGDEFAKRDIHEVVPLVEQPKELKGGSLFPHQLEALNWLRKCWNKSKNVILADEMGLGKTVSACSFISSLYFEFKVKLPCLVLVPLSTMPNWLAEFSSWAPHLNVVEYHGCAKARSVIRQYEWHASNADRPTKLTKAYKFNVLLTTYEMILADSCYLRGVSWEVLIVDEGHRLKNSESKLFSLLNTFSFQHRVLLTGTPLQNNLGEMYNLLNFLQPSSFPSLASFEEKFNDLSTAGKVEELKKLVSPHMLRRLKKDAMQNIPPKTERMVPVELTSIQAEYYRAMLTKNYQILRNIGKGVAQQSMLNIVMQLRKVCNHPYLIPGTEPESGSAEFLQEMRIKASAKLNLLHSMLKIMHKEGHRVLIFSQMTKLLDILEDYLTAEFGQGTFERVDGSVSVADRQAAIARFNRDKTRFVFLLSTRSCGLGINLATADTVIIYDSDFNPHADIQAMNRAHRIGQSNRLLVYRLVVRASVEERILQLAKKKLMLDQLFVNKSGSQKEVEDILRWGTEELFSSCEGENVQNVKNHSIQKVDATADGDYKNRRRGGGLGDVYKDKCTDGGTRIVWDECAISKLLDRSNLLSGHSENMDTDLENDLLGSVKSLDWNEEPVNEDPSGSEMLTNLVGEGFELSSDAKEENTNTVMEENEWDRLLRVRWEKYQLEEEAVLGRGKRLRKAVSYKETFSSLPTEALSESGNEEEEPVREYTPAGRALKEKFAKLRARQKERIAQRHIKEFHSSPGRLDLGGPAPFPLVNRVADNNTDSKPDLSNVDPLVNREEAKCTQPVDHKNNNNAIFKHGKASKHGHKKHHKNHHDLSNSTPENVCPAMIPPSKHFQKIFFESSLHSSNLLPVLGLCAPNASDRNQKSRIFRTNVSKAGSSHEKRTVSVGLSEFISAPTADIRASADAADVASRKALNDSSTLQDAPGEAFQHRFKSSIPDYYFPFGSPTPPTSGNLSEKWGASFSSFHEKLGLPKLILDEKRPLMFALPSKSSLKLQTEFSPNISLGTNMELANGSCENLSNVPLVPSFGPELSELLKQKQMLPDSPPLLGLGNLQTTDSIPENHKKVLDNIMMRTRSAAHKFWKKRHKFDLWSEDELDALWIGVRRHGRGNWDAMLRDPKIKILKHRSIEELSSRWSEEQYKITDGPAPLPRTSNFSSISSDGMIANALVGSKFSPFVTEPAKYHSHLTDIKLGCGNLLSTFPSLDQSAQLGMVNKGLAPLSCGQSDKVRPYFEDLPAGMLNRLENTNLHIDQLFNQSSISVSHFGSGNLGMILPSSCVAQKEEILAANKTVKLPSLLDKLPNLLPGIQNIHSLESFGMPIDAKQKQVLSKSLVDDYGVPSSSKANKLPHWLREAVTAPSRHPEQALPPSVSAIAQAVRLVYGEDKSTIPPFEMTDPPPLQPKDPRKFLRKRRKLERQRQVAPVAACSTECLGISAPGSIQIEAPLVAPSVTAEPALMAYSVSSVSSAMHSSGLPVLLPSTIPTESPRTQSSVYPISIPKAPPLTQSSTQETQFLPTLPQPLLPSSIHSESMLFPSSLPSLTALMPFSIPTLPSFTNECILAKSALMPCSFFVAPPLKANFRSLPGKAIGNTFPSLNLNLNSPSSSNGAQGMQTFAMPSPPFGSLPSIDPSSSQTTVAGFIPPPRNDNFEHSPAKYPESSQHAEETLIGDVKGSNTDQKVSTNSDSGCVLKLNCDEVRRTQSDDFSYDKADSCRVDDEIEKMQDVETISEQKIEKGS